MKPIRPLFLLTAILMLSMISGCALKQQRYTGSNNYITVTAFDNASFDGITVTGSPDVEYTQTPEPGKVLIYGPDNLVDLLELNIRGGVLTVQYKSDIIIAGDRRPKVIASGRELRKVTVTGSGDIEIKNTVEGDNLEVMVTGSGDVEAHRLHFRSINAWVTGSGDIDLGYVQCDHFSAQVTGSGDIEAGGEAGDASLTVSGSGDIDAEELRVKNTSARVTGSGSIDCRAEQRLDATVQGSGDITYRGNPAQLTLNGKKGSIRKK